MSSETLREMRRMVCRDGGVPSSVADELIGETPDICAQEVLEWVRARRGEDGVRESLRGFHAANERESPDEIRARVARDLRLPFELRQKMSTATRTEAEVADDALALLKQSGGQAALDAGVRQLQNMAANASIREWALGGAAAAVDSDDMNERMRAETGIFPNPS